jgi:hypothetical protein
MKLLFCKNCCDVISLTPEEERFCKCKNVHGKYTDSLNAVYSGDAIPIGFNNNTFAYALKNQPDNGMGENFDAFVIPKKCDTFRKVD